MLTEFDWTRALTSGALSLSMFMQGSLSIIMGGINDRLGPRLVLTIAGLLVGLGYLLTAYIGTVWQLYLFYGVMAGVGMSGVLVPLTSTIARWFVSRRNVMTGIVMGGIGIGTLVAPPVANWLISTYDWRVSYIILGSAVMVVVIAAAQFLKRDPARISQMPYSGNKEGEQQHRAEAEGFTLREATLTGQLWLVVAMFVCLGFSWFSIMVHIVPHITDLGISTANAANILAAMGGASVIGNVVLGVAADRIGNKQVCVISFILVVICLFFLVAVREVWMFYLFAVGFGIGQGGCSTSESPLIARLFGLSSHGSILGVVSFGFTMGAAVGPLLTGYIFDVTGSYQVAFFICAAISVVGLVLAALLTPIRSEQVKAKVGCI